MVVYAIQNGADLLTVMNLVFTISVIAYIAIAKWVISYLAAGGEGNEDDVEMVDVEKQLNQILESWDLSKYARSLISNGWDSLEDLDRASKSDREWGKLVKHTKMTHGHEARLRAKIRHMHEDKGNERNEGKFPGQEKNEGRANSNKEKQGHEEGAVRVAEDAALASL